MAFGFLKQGDDKGGDAEKRADASVRALRARLMELKGLLDSWADDSHNAGSMIEEFNFKEYLGKIDTLFTESGVLLKADCNVMEKSAGTMERLSCVWEEVGSELGQLKNLAGSTNLEKDIPDKIRDINPKLCRAILLCNRMVIPRQVNEYLHNQWTGGRLVFHDVFKDVVCPDQEKELLEWMHDQPMRVDGIVDTSQGVIIAVSPNRVRQAGSLAIFAGLFLVGYLAPWLLSSVFSRLVGPGWPIPSTMSLNLITVYTFLVIGAIGHGAIDLLKDERAGSGIASSAFGEMLRYVHSRESAVFRSWLMLMAVFVGLVFTQTSISWQMALASGYSLDSIFDVFSEQITKRAATAAEEARTQAAKAFGASGSTP